MGVGIRFFYSLFGWRGLIAIDFIGYCLAFFIFESFDFLDEHILHRLKSTNEYIPVILSNNLWDGFRGNTDDCCCEWQFEGIDLFFIFYKN